MAKQAGEIFIEGTFDDLTFYKMEGKYYVRMKSSLTGKKFWKSKIFERSRESCKRFSEGNQLASKVYRMVYREKRVYSLFCFLKRRAILLLKEGKSKIEAEEVLMDYLHQFGLVEKNSIRDIKSFDQSIADKSKKTFRHFLPDLSQYKNCARRNRLEKPLHFDVNLLLVQPIAYSPHKCDYG